MKEFCKLWCIEDTISWNQTYFYTNETKVLEKYKDDTRYRIYEIEGVKIDDRYYRLHHICNEKDFIKLGK